MKAAVKTQSGLLRFDMVRPCADCPFRTDTPCADCPFRTDTPCALSPDNAQGALEGLVFTGDAFACHKTVEYETPGLYEGGTFTERTQHCAGAMIFLEKLREPNRMMLKGLAEGAFDPERLDMGARVVSSASEFLRGQRLAREKGHPE